MSSLKFNDCNSFELLINNKKIYIINFGEIHGRDSKINFSIFNNYKTMFYVEQPFRIFNKQIRYTYFKKINSKRTTKQRQKNNITTYSSEGYNNMYYLNLYFANWFKENNYKFDDNNDKQLINKSKPYNKLWNYCPCEYRDGNEFFYNFTEPLYILLHYYLIYKHYNNFKEDINDFMKFNYNEPFDFLKIKIMPYNEFKNIIINAINKFTYYDTLPFNDKIYKKIHSLLIKYYNKPEYDQFFEKPNFKNLELYFKGINLSEMTIDLFNIITFFNYEKELTKYKSIINFIKFYYDYMIYSLFPCGIDIYFISPYDIMLFINLNKNLTKYDYHVIYNGTFHRFIFQYYLNFI